MTETTTSPDSLNFMEEEKIPSGINVLTILTFIGCAIGLIFSIASPYLINFSKQMMDKASMQDGITDKQLIAIENGKAALEITQQYIVPLVIIALIGIVLCFIGALWMRKLKKDGFWLYVSGELLPVLCNFIFLGKYAFIDWKSGFNYLLPVVFIILYAMQIKYLVKK
ncbi:MAG: DUF4064 domain-containing protein [Ferruginibacter sp.]